jgi:hypothetical protein
LVFETVCIFCVDVSALNWWVSGVTDTQHGIIREDDGAVVGKHLGLNVLIHFMSCCAIDAVRLIFIYLLVNFICFFVLVYVLSSVHCPVSVGYALSLYFIITGFELGINISIVEKLFGSVFANLIADDDKNESGELLTSQYLGEPVVFI